MTQHNRLYRIITLAVLWLLALTPLTSEAGGGSSLAALCSKINCWSVAFALPKIAQANSPITPGGYVVIQGSGLGQEPGELWLTGLWKTPVGDELVAAPIARKLTIPPSKPPWDFWNPTIVLGQVPDNITQVRDQQVKLQIKTKNGLTSNEYSVKFVAKRDEVFIPSSDPAVTVASCSDDANENSCSPGPCLLPGTLCGFHENCWGCVGDDSGTDTFNITLKNDWVFTSSPLGFTESRVGEASASGPSVSQIAPSVWQLGVSWSATPDDWVLYSVGVFITGSIGVPWR